MEYLHEMKNNLRLDVEGVGKISLDITKFIKKKYLIIYLASALTVELHFNILRGSLKLLGKAIERQDHFKYKWDVNSILKLL